MLIRKVKRLGYWLWEVKLVFLMISYLALAWSLLNFFNYTEPSFRVIGLVLQILGIATVIHGLNQTRDQFNHKSYQDLLGDWLKRCPIKDKPIFIEPESIRTSVSIGDVILTTVFKLDINSPIEEQLAKIEKEILDLQKQIDNAGIKNREEINKLSSDINVEKNERNKAINRTLKIIESSSTGGVHISLIGTIWLLIGVISSSLSPELSKLLG